ncbi:hypothetical protein C5S31_03455 [ANME-1 cluster archaeon GoMg2]|nr:hypothetical protein [ANME-1 cluster archaeon GoMg2]
MKLITLSLLILVLLSFAYPVNAATTNLVRSTVDYTDNVDQGAILEFVWSTPGLSNEEVRCLIKDIPSEFDVNEANVLISSNMGAFDKVIKSSKIALKSTTALNGNLEVKIKITIPSDCPENTYALKLSEMVGSDSNMLNPSSISITVQKSSTNPPSVTVLYPNGGESIPVGTQVQVSAHATDDTAVTSVTFYYSSDGGTNWNLIGAGTRVSGTDKEGVWNKIWNTDGLSASSNYKIKAVASDGTLTGEDESDSMFSLVGTIAPEEEWNRTFGGTGWDTAYSVQQTADGGYILAGFTESFGTGSSDVWLVKTDSSGHKQWDKAFGGTNKDMAYSVQQTADGGYILVGYTCSEGTENVLLVKIDPTGNEQWEKTFGGTNYDRAHSVQQTSDGGYILAGHTGSYGAGYLDFWLVKTDSNGNKLWDKTFGGTDWDTACSVQQTADGGYILAGSTSSYGAGSYDFWLVKTDPSGNMQWDKTFGGTAFDEAFSAQQTSDGGYILVGCTCSSGAGSEDVWLVKTDSGGNMQWDKTVGSTEWDRGQSVQWISDGGYILAGWTASYGAGDYDFWLIKVKREGAISIFDTQQSENPYPSISGTHTGTTTPNQDITVQKLYTYPCAGTGGHTEYVRIYGNEIDKSASWNGYAEDRDTLTFDSSFTLEAGKTYNYVIETGSYPQIHHTAALQTDNGRVNCTKFTDANGKEYSDWIPAIRLFS